VDSMRRMEAAAGRSVLLAVREDAPPVVLSTHLDDAVWACFSVLTDAQPRPVVATAFAGEPPPEPGWWDRKCGITDSAAHVRNRRAEDAAVLEGLGCRVVHLPLLDDQYRDGPLPAEEIVRALAEQVPTTSRLYAPGGIGEHPDHLIVRDAGALLAASGVPTTVYADYCYSTRQGWPTWVEPDGRAEADEQWRRAIGGLVGERLAHPRVRRLVAAESERKLAAMKGYVTQYEAIEAEEPRWQQDGLPPSDPRKRAIEVFYDLDGARAAS
jgi:LmbE family N-acetylglucosaminyl deacetylase